MLSKTLSMGHKLTFCHVATPLECCNLTKIQTHLIASVLLITGQLKTVIIKTICQYNRMGRCLHRR